MACSFSQLSFELGNLSLREGEREKETFSEVHTQRGSKGVYQLGVLFSLTLQDTKNSGKAQEVFLDVGKTSARHGGSSGLAPWLYGVIRGSGLFSSANPRVLPSSLGLSVAAGTLAITSTPQVVG